MHIFDVTVASDFESDVNQFGGFLHRLAFPVFSTRFFDRFFHLKVVGNEKEGGSGKWQMIDIGLGLW